MFLKQVKGEKGRVFLQIINGFRDEDGKVKHEVIKSIGYLDEYTDKYEDPIAHFRQLAKEMTKEQNPIKTLKFDLSKEIKEDTSSLRNLGYLTLKPILENLKLEPLFNLLNIKHNMDVKIYDIFTFLVYSQIVNPSSKRSSYYKKNQFFENYNFSEDQMYRSLSYIGNSFETIKDQMFDLVNEAYSLDTSTTFYDGTNFYFEINKEDDFRKKGPSKEMRKSPLVSIGLLLDKNQIPIDISVYPGNENEGPHFTETIKNMKRKRKITGKTIYVADKGLNNGNNIYNALVRGDGYIYSQTIKGAKKTVKNQIASALGYEDIMNEYGEVVYKIKGFIDTEIINYKDNNGNEKKAKVEQLKVMTWSKKYADKAKYEREKAIRKAKSLINRPTEYKKKQLGNAAKYLNRVTFDDKGNVIKDKSELLLNTKLIEEESRLDGYYLLATSELKMNPKEVFEAYKQLSKIEETFKVAKLFLKVRPMYLQLEERIKAHVLVSYTSLILLRIMESKVLDSKFSFDEIINGIRNFQGAMIKPNMYFIFSYNNYVLELAKKSKSNAKLEIQSLSNIKKLFKNY